MKKRQLLTMVLAGAMVMGTVGYGTPVLADSEKKDVKLGVSIMELTAYPWFQGVVDGCEQWADENSDKKGVNIKFDFEDSHSDVQTMLTNVLGWLQDANESWLGEVLQNPVVLGYQATDAIIKVLLDNEELPEKYDLPEPEVITPSNISDYDWKNWEWLG